MSGRAGRRGLDDRGIVIMMIDDKMETATAKTMLSVSCLSCLSVLQEIAYFFLVFLSFFFLFC